MKGDKRLLEPGWAGELTLEEARFIQDKIFKDIRYRRRWGFKGKSRPALTKIAQRAFPENPEYARKHIIGAMSRNPSEKRKIMFSRS